MVFVHELFFSSVDGRRRERERVAYLARTPSASPRRTVGIGDEARVLFTRAAASRRASPSSTSRRYYSSLASGPERREGVSTD